MSALTEPKGGKTALFLFSSPIAMVGWASILASILLLIVFTAASSRMDRDPRALIEFWVIGQFILGVSLVIAGICHQKLTNRD